MLGNRKFIVDTHCEVYEALKPVADEIFWDLKNHEFINGAIYIIGREQFRLYHSRIREAINNSKVSVIFSNPAEGSATIVSQMLMYGIDDLVEQGRIIILSGGDINPDYTNYMHENFINKCFGYKENMLAQQRSSEIYTKTSKPYQFLFLNGRFRHWRKTLIDHFKSTFFIEQALWSNLDSAQGDLHFLPPEYEVDRYHANLDVQQKNINTLNQGFVKTKLFGKEWGDIYINPQMYVDTYFSLVTETVFDYPYSFRTEKIWKPIFMGHPWIAVANEGYYRDIRNLGFKTYGDLIDESFDQITNNQDRLNRIITVVEDLSKQGLISFLQAAESTSKYNQQHMQELSRQTESQFLEHFLNFVKKHFNE